MSRVLNHSAIIASRWLGVGLFELARRQHRRPEPEPVEHFQPAGAWRCREIGVDRRPESGPILLRHQPEHRNLSSAEGVGPAHCHPGRRAERPPPANGARRRRSTRRRRCPVRQRGRAGRDRRRSPRRAGRTRRPRRARHVDAGAAPSGRRSSGLGCSHGHGRRFAVTRPPARRARRRSRCRRRVRAVTPARGGHRAPSHPRCWLPRTTVRRCAIRRRPRPRPRWSSGRSWSEHVGKPVDDGRLETVIELEQLVADGSSGVLHVSAVPAR